MLLFFMEKKPRIYLSGDLELLDFPRRRKQTIVRTITTSRIRSTAITIPAIAPSSKLFSDEATDVNKSKTPIIFVEE